MTTYDRYFTEVCPGRYNMNYCTLKNTTLWIGIHSPVAGIQYNITVLVVADSESLPIQSGMLYLVDIKSQLTLTFSMDVPTVSGVNVNFISPNASEVYDVYLRRGIPAIPIIILTFIGQPGNSTTYDYSMTTTGGIINSTYSECNVDDIVGEWFYRITKRGTVPRSYYTFIATHGQPAPIVTNLAYDTPATVSIPAGGSVFYSVYGALGQAISLTAFEVTPTNNISIYVSQNTCPSAASYRYKRDAYARNSFIIRIVVLIECSVYW